MPNSVQEKPTLLVLHGAHGFADHTLYVEFWSQFSDIAQVLFLDQRGCGRSDQRNAAEWNLARWSEDVYQFCETLGIKKPIVAGVSMSGHVMCEHATKYPEHPGGLIFCNTEARFVLDDVCTALEKLGGQEVAELARRQFTTSTAETTAEYTIYVTPYYAKNSYTATELRRCKTNTAVFQHYCENEIQEFNYLNQLKKIQRPTLLMVGMESPLHPPQRAVEMAEQIASKWVETAYIKGAGAPVYKDQPQYSHIIVREFLQKFV